jgi:hypothetical protein
MPSIGPYLRQSASPRAFELEAIDLTQSILLVLVNQESQLWVLAEFQDEDGPTR